LNNIQSNQITVPVCLEWETLPVDNNMGETFGTQDTGWRARGARVVISYNGFWVYNDYLSPAGCVVLNLAGPGGTLEVRALGSARLVGGGGYNYLHRMYQSLDNLVYIELSATISNVQAPGLGFAYRPEIPGNDAIGILSYAAQQRFHGGVSGANFIVLKAVCADLGSGTCYDSDFLGEDALFIPNSYWQRKFLIGHLYGLAILAQAANYSANCSFGGANWSMENLEYSSCAALMGWANFVAADIWNDHTSSDNPNGVFVYWNGISYPLDLGTYSKCYDVYPPAAYGFFCVGYGYPKDWMRQWWDYHTNNTVNSPGTPPTHGQLLAVIDDVNWPSWQGDLGSFYTSKQIQEALGWYATPQGQRWAKYACQNGVDVIDNMCGF
jgi:hypothetical protein